MGDILCRRQDFISPVRIRKAAGRADLRNQELFWRGYVQSTLSAKWNPDKGAAVTLAAYTLVHLPSLNFMLIAAAFTAGLVWGLLYRFWPERLWALVISHALWDAAVFVWFPV